MRTAEYLVNPERAPASLQQAVTHLSRVATEPALHPILRLQQLWGNRQVWRQLGGGGFDHREGEAPPEVEDRIAAARGGGVSMGADPRTDMESAFGADFAGVRLHTDSEANELNRALAARAFTTGADIFFREGEYQPATDAGRELLAHELTHVVQQDPDRMRRKLLVGDPMDQYEKEADEVARAVAGSAISRSTVQRCACGGGGGSGSDQECAECGEGG